MKKKNNNKHQQIKTHTNIKQQLSYLCDSMALVSSRFALSIENLNLALTSDLLQETSSRYSDR